MSNDNSKKVGQALGTATILLGASLGIVAQASASQNVLDQASFKQRLEAIRQAVEAGEISPLVADGAGWIAMQPRQVKVADWLQTWNQRWSKYDTTG